MTRTWLCSQKNAVEKLSKNTPKLAYRKPGLFHKIFHFFVHQLKISITLKISNMLLKSSLGFTQFTFFNRIVYILIYFQSALLCACIALNPFPNLKSKPLSNRTTTFLIHISVHLLVAFLRFQLFALWLLCFRAVARRELGAFASNDAHLLYVTGL